MRAVKKRRNSKGFSMLELLVAITVLGVISTAIGLVMTRSSQTYKQVSTESQMQSEAQVVANSISNIAIDSISAVDEMASDISTDISTMGDFDMTAGKSLVLTNDVDGTYGMQYIIARDMTEKKLYYFDRAKDDTGAYGSVAHKSVLADNVEDVIIDTSRVDKENIVAYTIVYKKNGRNFSGNYQVFMRNKKYVAPPAPSGVSENNAPRLTNLSLTPSHVYIETHAGKTTGYSVKNGENYIPTTLTSGAGSVEFSSILTYSGAVADDLKKSDWTLLGADGNLFGLSTDKGETSDLVFPRNSTYGFNDLNKFQFYVMASKGSKMAQALVQVKIVKNLKLSAIAGVSPWKNAYFNAPYFASKSAMVPDSNYGVVGKTVTISAALEQYNTSDGLVWQLYRCAADKDKETDWVPCTESKYASLVTVGEGSTVNTLQLGSESNGMQFKVVATSIYDSSFSDSIYIGVVPEAKSDNGGLFSRGYYMNIQDFFTNGDDGKPVYIQGNGSERQYWVKKIKNIKFEPGVNMDNMKDLDKAFKYSPSTNTLMVDYGVFQYSKQQSATAYKQGFEINMTITYDDIDGHEQTKGVFKFPILPTDVVPIGSSTICVAKGGVDELPVQFTYTNLISRNLIGVYTKQSGDTDFSDNINRPNFESTDKYLTITLHENELGDVYHYVDTAKFDIAGKTNLKTYPINAITVRITMDDYYQLVDHNMTKSDFSRNCGAKTITGKTGPGTDYTVYVANVVGSDAYFAGPDATKAASAGAIGWINTVPTASTGADNVTGLRTNGEKVKARVYKSGSKFLMLYGGEIYTFDRTYNCWKK